MWAGRIGGGAPSEKKHFTDPVFLSHAHVMMLGISLQDSELRSALLEVKLVGLRGDGVGPRSRALAVCVVFRGQIP